MTVVVLGILAIIWVAVLGSYAKDRFGGRNHDSVSAFRSQISTLQRTHSGPPSMYSQRQAVGAPNRTAAHWRSEAARIRRRNILFGLLGALITSVVLTIVTGSMLLILLTVVCAAALAGYVTLLVNQQRIIAEQQAKVRRIHPATRRAASQPMAIARRS